MVRRVRGGEGSGDLVEGWLVRAAGEERDVDGPVWRVEWWEWRRWWEGWLRPLNVVWSVGVGEDLAVESDADNLHGA